MSCISTSKKSSWDCFKLNCPVRLDSTVVHMWSTSWRYSTSRLH